MKRPVRRRLLATGALVTALVIVSVSVFAARAASSAESPAVRYRPIDIYLDADSPVSAYQIEVRVDTGSASFVGIEGGEAPLEEPPYYDPEALTDGRIVLAAFHTTEVYPPGRHRVATLHAREVGDVSYQVTVMAAADATAGRIAARATIEPGRLAQ